MMISVKKINESDIRKLIKITLAVKNFGQTQQKIFVIAGEKQSLIA